MSVELQHTVWCYICLYQRLEALEHVLPDEGKTAVFRKKDT